MQMDSSELPLAEDPAAVRWSRASVQTGAGSKPNGPASVDGNRSTSDAPYPDRILNRDDASDDGDAESTSRGAASDPSESPLLKQTQVGEVVSTSRVESSGLGHSLTLKQSQAGATDTATPEESSWAPRPGVCSAAPALDIVVPGTSSSSVPDPDSLPPRPSLKLVGKDTEPIASKWALSPETRSGETATVISAQASSASMIEAGQSNDKPVKAPPAVPKMKRFLIAAFVVAVLVNVPLIFYYSNQSSLPFVDTPNAWLNRLEKAWLERQSLSMSPAEPLDTNGRFNLIEKRREAARICNECIEHVVSMGPAAVPLLVADLKSDEPMASISTMLLQKIGAPSVPPLIEALKNSVNPNSGNFLTPDSAYENVLMNCGPAAQEAAAALCASSSERDRFVGAKLLSRFCLQGLFRRGANLSFSRTIRPDEVRDVLIGLDKSTDSSVRCALITCLSAVEPGTPSVDAALSRILLTSAEPTERAEAARSVGAIAKIASRDGNVPAVTLLSQALAKDDDMYVRLACARSLSELPYVTPPAVAALRKAEHDPVQPVRVGAFAALCKAAETNNSCIPDLTAALSDEDDAIARHALNTVGDLSPTVVSESPAMVANVVSRLGTAKESMRSNVIRALQNLGRTVPNQVVPEVVKALKTATPNERRELVSSLDIMGEPAVKLALPELEKIADDPADGGYRDANRILDRWHLKGTASKSKWM